METGMKLYILARVDLGDYSSPAAQACHAVAAFMAFQKASSLHWGNKTIVLLAVKDEQWLQLWCDKIRLASLTYTRFEEPDLEGSLTAVACYTAKNIFNGLPLLK